MSFPASRDVVLEVNEEGFSVLYEPANAGDTIADIVFIHGLQGHPQSTWACEPEKRTANAQGDLKTLKKKISSNFSENTQVSSTLDAPVEAATSYTFWPYHLLSKEEKFKNVRILTWGYKSTVTNFFEGPASRSNIPAHAENLLGDLVGVRNDDPERPIIFVAHSLGGIILKDMLNKSNDLSQNRVPKRKVMESLSGILFLGTPHKGSNVAETGEILRRIASAVGFDTAKQNLGDLAVGSSFLQLTHERFLRILLRDMDFGDDRVITFRESLPMATSKSGAKNLVVEKHSSDFSDDNPKYTITANHIDMCKFSSTKDNGYKQVSQQLRQLCDKIVAEKKEKTRSNEEAKVFDAACLDTLLFPEMNYRRQEILDPQKDSYMWIFNHKSFTQWVSDNHGLLWIQGNPGSGKSTLMKKVHKILQEPSEISERVYLTFFFHKRGTRLQQTPVGLFRALLHQLLSQVPAAAGPFVDLYTHKKLFQTVQGTNWDWNENELRDVLKDSLILAVKTHKILLFLDALDEAGEEAARSIVSYLYSINEQFLRSANTTSICFSCRHFPLIKTDEGYQICLEEENEADLRSYAQAEIRRTIKPINSALTNEELAQLRDNILSKASGVFLWVCLTIVKIAKQYREGTSLQVIVDQLDEVPSKLSETYKEILMHEDGVDSNDCEDTVIRRERTLHLMQWICFAQYPLTLEELRFGLASDDSVVRKGQRSAQRSANFVMTDLQMRSVIIELSGGLLEVQAPSEKTEGEAHSIVQFIHQSVDDFLLEEGLQLLSGNTRDDPAGVGHDRLCRSCLNYFTFGEVLDFEIPVDTSGRFDFHEIEEQTSSREKNFPFLNYATERWPLHAECAEGFKIHQLHVLERFQGPAAEHFDHWTAVSYMLDEDFSWPNMTLLQVASKHNLVSVVQALLRQNVSIDATDTRGYTALHYAAEVNNHEIISLLLRANAQMVECDSTVCSGNGDTPLSCAAYSGSHECARLLIKKGADLNSCGPLLKATVSGDVRMINILLDHGADINYRGFNGSCEETALQCAITCHKSKLEIFNHLIQRGADITGKNEPPEKSSLLHVAAALENEAAVKLLLAKGLSLETVNLFGAQSWKIESTNGVRGNVLQYAPFLGKDAIVRLLLEKGADVNAKCGTFNIALIAALSSVNYSGWWAIQHIKPVVSILLSEGANIEIHGGRYYNVLHTAEHMRVHKRDEPEKKEIIDLLLAHGAVPASSQELVESCQGCKEGGSLETLQYSR